MTKRKFLKRKNSVQDGTREDGTPQRHAALGGVRCVVSRLPLFRLVRCFFSFKQPYAPTGPR